MPELGMGRQWQWPRPVPQPWLGTLLVLPGERGSVGGHSVQGLCTIHCSCGRGTNVSPSPGALRWPRWLGKGEGQGPGTRAEATPGAP